MDDFEAKLMAFVDENQNKVPCSSNTEPASNNNTLDENQTKVPDVTFSFPRYGESLDISVEDYFNKENPIPEPPSFDSGNSKPLLNHPNPATDGQHFFTRADQYFPVWQHNPISAACFDINTLEPTINYSNKPETVGNYCPMNNQYLSTLQNSQNNESFWATTVEGPR